MRRTRVPTINTNRDDINQADKQNDNLLNTTFTEDEFVAEKTLETYFKSSTVYACKTNAEIYLYDRLIIVYKTIVHDGIQIVVQHLYETDLSSLYNFPFLAEHSQSASNGRKSEVVIVGFRWQEMSTRQSLSAKAMYKTEIDITTDVDWKPLQDLSHSNLPS